MTRDDRDIGIYIGTVISNYSQDHPGEILVELFSREIKAGQGSKVWMPFLTQNDVLGLGFFSMPQAGDSVIVVIFGSSNLQAFALSSFNGISNGYYTFGAGEWGHKYYTINKNPDFKMLKEIGFNEPDKADSVDGKILNKVELKSKPSASTADKNKEADDYISSNVLEDSIFYSTNGMQIAIDETVPLNPKVVITVRPHASSIDDKGTSSSVLTEEQLKSTSIVEISAQEGINIFSAKGINITTDNFNVLANRGINLESANITVTTNKFEANSDGDIEIVSQGKIDISSSKELTFNKGEKIELDKSKVEGNVEADMIVGESLVRPIFVLPKIKKLDGSDDLFVFDSKEKMKFNASAPLSAQTKKSDKLSFELENDGKFDKYI